MTRIAINGFGRIGRLVFRALYTQGLFGKEVEVVAVGDIVPADNLAYLLKYDSIQGRFKGEVGEQSTMFFLDPSGNALEFKAFVDPSLIFAK